MAEWHQVRLRAEALKYEATALAALLAETGDPSNTQGRLAAEDQLLTANYQKSKLTNRAAARTGVAAYLGEVDVEQNDKQVEVLLGEKAKVATRRTALGG